MKTQVLPKEGQYWRHYNGVLYKVLHIANHESTRKDYPVTVVYQTVENGNIWCRKLSDWHRSFKPDFKHNEEAELVAKLRSLIQRRRTRMNKHGLEFQYSSYSAAVMDIKVNVLTLEIRNTMDKLNAIYKARRNLR